MWEFEKLYDSHGYHGFGEWLFEVLIITPATYLWDFGIKDEEDKAFFVILSVLKEKADELLNQILSNHKSLTDLILSSRDIKDMLPDCTDDEISSIVAYLHIDKKNVDIIRPERDDREGLKINPDKEQKCYTTSTDLGIFLIKETTTKIETQKNLLSEELNSLFLNIQECHESDQKKAISLYKKSKDIKRILDKRERCFNHMTKVYAEFQDKNTTEELFETMKKASKTLRELSNQNEDDGFQETMNNLQYRWANNEEVKNVINNECNFHTKKSKRGGD
jgi:hypothetical protein